MTAEGQTRKKMYLREEGRGGKGEGKEGRTIGRGKGWRKRMRDTEEEMTSYKRGQLRPEILHILLGRLAAGVCSLYR